MLIGPISLRVRLAFASWVVASTPATLRADTFAVATIDSAGNVGEYPSIAIDAVGNPHVSYWAASPQFDLKYANLSSSGWQIESVDAPSFAGNGSSITVDMQGKPHIAFRDEGAHLLRYAEKSTGIWNFETVGLEAIDFISLRLGTDGTPHIGYLDRNLHLTYATRANSTWTLEWVESLVAIGWTSLRLDASGLPCMAASGGSIRYLCRSETGWSGETLSGSEGSSLAFDSAGNPHITYTAQEGIVYASRNEGGWSTEVVTAEHARTGTSLAIDPANGPHICWVRGETLFYAVKFGPGWRIQPIEQIGLVDVEGGTPALALDSTGASYHQ